MRFAQIKPKRQGDKTMKNKYEVRHIVTDVVSIPVYRNASKTEAYRQAAKDGWGTVYRDENNELVCDEDCSASLYTKNGGYFGIFPYDEISTKEMPKQPACAAIIISDSDGFSFWAEDISKIRIFVTYDENGLIDTYRLDYGDDQPEEWETVLSFEDLYKPEEEDWQETYRADIPGTVEYQHKQEAAQAAEAAGATWMDAAQQEDFRRICGLIDTIKSGRDFYRVMDKINNGGYSVDVINAAREYKKCFNSAQYEQPEEVAKREELREHCRKYGFVMAEDNTDGQQEEAGTAAEAASKGQEAALGTPDTMAGTDATAADAGQDNPTDGQQGGISAVYTDDLGVARCGDCNAELLCNRSGDR